MQNKIPVSVTIIACNEADRIPLTINSVRDWADEVIVVDSGSVDNTREVAEGLGAKFIHNDWQGYGPQKVFAEKQTRNNWILNLDADEELTPQLQQEIIALFASGEPQQKAYRIKICAIYPHQKKLPFFPAGTTQVRLYDKTLSGFKASAVHDSVQLGAGVTEKMLKGRVVHRSFRNHAHAVEKINSYTSMQAEDLFKKGRNPVLARIVIEPLAAFLKCYFLKRYMFYGIDGFIHSCIYAFSKTIRLAKAREKFQMENKA
jgi:glycosyltransferase involved in cell wall biosynthesis